MGRPGKQEILQQVCALRKGKKNNLWWVNRRIGPEDDPSRFLKLIFISAAGRKVESKPNLAESQGQVARRSHRLNNE